VVRALIRLRILKHQVSRNLRIFVCDVTIPRDRLVVITGVPGPGKPALVVRPALYAGGQRRYVGSLSPCARRFPGLISAACVWGGTGLSFDWADPGPVGTGTSSIAGTEGTEERLVQTCQIPSK